MLQELLETLAKWHALLELLRVPILLHGQVDLVTERVIDLHHERGDDIDNDECNDVEEETEVDSSPELP